MDFRKRIKEFTMIYYLVKYKYPEDSIKYILYPPRDFFYNFNWTVVFTIQVIKLPKGINCGSFSEEDLKEHIKRYL